MNRLRIYTARISYGNLDRLDITRKSAGPLGIVLAPSWSILGPALNKRRANALTDENWDEYKLAYIAEMRISYRKWPAKWAQILSMSEVTLCCYCTDHLRCHRKVAAELLVKAARGCAVYLGER